jgi:hypothetical protein
VNVESGGMLECLMLVSPLPTPNETVEKHDFECANHTQTQVHKALLGNYPYYPPDHSLVRSSPMPGSQLAIP